MPQAFTLDQFKRKSVFNKQKIVETGKRNLFKTVLTALIKKLERLE